ncbi:MAG: hypothetical protein HZA01_13125 [Nitrospinae bacterium]|nr:hypothetical protein [Nitrospinota bacterium]
MLLSNGMEKELIRVLGYEKFGLAPKEIPPFIRNLRAHAGFVETSARIHVIVSGPADNIFFECAIDGRAD